jgi:DNA-directed RNA polymerase sigma subunit (sigma70/sigma32)
LRAEEERLGEELKLERERVQQLEQEKLDAL